MTITIDINTADVPHTAPYTVINHVYNDVYTNIEYTDYCANTIFIPRLKGNNNVTINLLTYAAWRHVKVDNGAGCRTFH